VSELSQVIREIRRRKGMTTTQFAGLLGINQGTLSHYESGRTKPGYVLAGKLLQIAEGTEKNPIINRLHDLLGIAGGEQEVMVELSRIDRLRSVGEADLWVAMGLKELERFGKLSDTIISRRQEVDAALNVILELWLSADTLNPETRGAFDHAARFLKVALRVPHRNPKEDDSGEK
jgi:transcriptional regulator with XRE-family HTH domain